METETLLIKENSKKDVAAESAIINDTQEDVNHSNYARTHVPSVFEHQYAEYISGLKPPYFHHTGQKDTKKQPFNGD